MNRAVPTRRTRFARRAMRRAGCAALLAGAHRWLTRSGAERGARARSVEPRLPAARRGAAPRRAARPRAQGRACAGSSGIRTTRTRTICSRASRVDRGELQRAFDEWDMVLRLAPSHVGARKGMGFVLLPAGEADEAEALSEHGARRTIAAMRRSRRRSRTVRRLLRYAHVAGKRRAATLRAHAELLAAQRSRRAEEARAAVRRHARVRASRPRCCSTPTARARRGSTSTATATTSSQEVGAAAQRRERRGAARDAAPRPRRHGRSIVVRDGPRRSRWRRASTSRWLLVVAASASTPLGLRAAAARSLRAARAALARGGRMSASPFDGVLVAAHPPARRARLPRRRRGGWDRRRLEPADRAGQANASPRSRRRCIARRDCSAARRGLAPSSFLQLEAERGRICAVGRDDLVLVTSPSRGEHRLIRVEMLEALSALA